jgi:N-acetylglucosaminyldiphosphoundecaprenol N-acetyl-beta-D-mannosaminyltransferase
LLEGGVVNLRPRASLIDVITGRAPLVGSRLDSSRPAAMFSPIEARVHLGLAYGDLLHEERDALETKGKLSLAFSVLRSIATMALDAGSANAQEGSRRCWVVSAEVDNVSIPQAIEMISIAPSDSAERARVVHFVHPHALNLAVGDATLAANLRAADAVLPDGSGIRLAGRLLGTPLKHNVNGTDLIGPLCERLVRERTPLVLVGAAPGVAAACASFLIEKHPDLDIPIVSHGFLDEEATERLLARIAAVGRCVVLVGMGSPIQERWCWRHADAIRSATLVTVGGLFDFYSGRIPRASWAWRELGLEWVFRLIQEPRRLAKRYLVGNPLFVLRTLQQRVLSKRQFVASAS